MARLTIAEGANQGRVYEFDDTCDIGRGPQCQVRSIDLAVSRLHTRISRNGVTFHVEHLGSTTPTLVNGKVISKQPLKRGDVIRIGQMVFRFDDEQNAADLMKHAAIVADLDSPPKIVRTLAKTESLFDLTDQSLSAADVRKVATALRTLNSLSREIAHILDVDELLRQIPTRVLDLVSAQRAVILVVDETGALTVRAMHRRKEMGDREMSISTTILEHVKTKREAVLSRDAGQDSRFQHGLSIQASGLRSILCAPLLFRDNLMGAIYVDHDSLGAFTTSDLELVLGIADQCATALGVAQLHQEVLKRQQLEHDIKTAESVQRSFLPKETPVVPGFDFAVIYEPARLVSGDFYDFIPLPAERLAIALGDVSGKGLAAALIGARVARDLRFFAAADPDPGRVLAQLNRTVLETGHDNMFVTMIYLLLDPKTATLTYANAGHLPPLVRGESGMVTQLQTASGLPLGILPSNDYSVNETKLQIGDTVVLFTDGLTEAMNPGRQMLGMDEVVNALGRGPTHARLILKRLVEVMRRHVAGAAQSDDNTIICLEFEGRTMVDLESTLK